MATTGKNSEKQTQKSVSSQILTAYIKLCKEKFGEDFDIGDADVQIKRIANIIRITATRKEQ